MVNFRSMYGLAIRRMTNIACANCNISSKSTTCISGLYNGSGGGRDELCMIHLLDGGNDIYRILSF